MPLNSMKKKGWKTPIPIYKLKLNEYFAAFYKIYFYKDKLNYFKLEVSLFLYSIFNYLLWKNKKLYIILKNLKQLYYINKNLNLLFKVKKIQYKPAM